MQDKSLGTLTLPCPAQIQTQAGPEISTHPDRAGLPRCQTSPCDNGTAPNSSAPRDRDVPCAGVHTTMEGSAPAQTQIRTGRDSSPWPCPQQLQPLVTSSRANPQTLPAQSALPINRATSRKWNFRDVHWMRATFTGLQSSLWNSLDYKSR